MKPEVIMFEMPMAGGDQSSLAVPIHGTEQSVDASRTLLCGTRPECVRKSWQP
jgi:hypothetical protein